MDKQFFLVWGRSLEVRSTIEEALECGWWMSGSDEGWFDAIEVVNPDGATERMDSNHPTVADEFARREAAEQQQWKESAATRPFIGNITVDGKVLDSLYGDDDPDSKMAPLRALGERVKFEASRPAVRR